MSKTNRIFALLLAAIMCIGLIPMSAFAATGTVHPYAEGTVTIQSEYNGAFDYLEYYSNGTWKDLNTPKHWIVETGEIVYCVEHSEGNPHGNGYTETSPSSLFGTMTLEGLQSIFMYGYPCNLPDGFTEDEARQATANAIRFWLSEQGEPGSFSFTNRQAHPDWIRAKSGYEHVLTWADELLEHARNRDTITHNITFTPSELQLTKSGSSYTGQTRVTLTNINGGYTLNTSELPSGVSVSGYTGTGNDTLTITASQSLNGSSFVLAAEGSDSRCISNMAAYVPNGADLQNVFMCATTAQVVATASITVNTEAFGSLRIVKKGDDGSLLGGVKFGIYSDFACENLIKEVTTRSNGVATASDLPVGVVYVKELSTIEPYWIDNTVYTVEIPLNDTVEIEITNNSARGRIRIEKTGEAMTSVITTDTEWGTVNAPVYTAGGLEGAVFEIYDSDMMLVATMTTDEYGVAESDYDEAKTVMHEMALNGAAELMRRKVITNKVSIFVGYTHDEIPPTKGGTRLSVTTALASFLTEAAVEVYERTTNRSIPIRRLGIAFNDVCDEGCEGYDLFTDFDAVEREKTAQQAVIEIRQRFGKNAVLNGINFMPEGTQRERNTFIGGHRAGYDDPGGKS